MIWLLIRRHIALGLGAVWDEPSMNPALMGDVVEVILECNEWRQVF
ncbi:hypothetical protein [Parasulfuritortus cantonensis]|nr:hypothetical protein [Parasulfuritortus cantonensis]